MADLNSNNSFDSGASLLHGFSNDMASWEAPNTAFTSINASVSSASMRTVSPKDLIVDPLQSAPPSTTFTELTSPDIGDSPYINDSFETSPMYQGEPLMASDTWFSLFPEEETKPAPPATPALERTISSNSAGKSSASSANSPLVFDNSHRRKSSVTGSPAANASITKARRRKDPLPPIHVDPNDRVAMKRARNTLAARESRERKLLHVLNLEKRNAELEAEVEKWKSIALAQGYTGD